MNKILEATYHNGTLLLDNKLSSNLEGKKIKLIIIDNEGLEIKKQNFLKLASQHSAKLPKDYKFNRNEIYK